MAFGKAKPAAKEEPKTEEKANQPEFILRAKQSSKSEYWMTVGAMWPADFKDGSKGYSIKINNMPVNWDGDCLAMKPKPKE